MIYLTSKTQVLFIAWPAWSLQSSCTHVSSVPFAKLNLLLIFIEFVDILFVFHMID